ncbi:putative prolyl 4-hydroxylase 3 isoform A, partial [Glycine soja]
QGRCGVSRHQSHSHHTGLFALLRVLECIRIPEHKGKKWSTFSLVLWVLFFLTLILILLLALGIVYLPTTDDDFPTTDLSAFRRKTSQSGESLVENSEQWTEILSWEPRAFIYHNCLIESRRRFHIIRSWDQDGSPQKYWLMKHRFLRILSLFFMNNQIILSGRFNNNIL